MVFTSLPIYLDPPNWNQSNQQAPINTNEPPPHLMMTPQQNPRGPTGNGGNSNSSNIRPGFMTERARLAKIPQPEAALKCPRCDSTNTKFCYFNNYSLSQPRHFCKTCRRYWTRGGALRSVPVGGGCRRNKRSSSSKSGSKSGASASSSSSTATAAGAAAVASSSSSSSVTCSGSTVIPSSFSLNHQLQLPFLGSANLHPLIGGDQFGMQSQPLDAVDNYQLGLGLDQWRIQQIQQFPFMGGMDGSSVQVHHGNNSIMYNPNFDGGDQLGFSSAMSNKVSSSSAATTSAIITQMASVKMEDSGHHQPQLGLDLARHYLGFQGSGTDHYLGGSNGGGGWIGDLSGFNSSSS